MLALGTPPPPSYPYTLATLHTQVRSAIILGNYFVEQHVLAGQKWEKRLVASEGYAEAALHSAQTTTSHKVVAEQAAAVGAARARTAGQAAPDRRARPTKEHVSANFTAQHPLYSLLGSLTEDKRVKMLQTLRTAICQVRVRVRVRVRA